MPSILTSLLKWIRVLSITLAISRVSRRSRYLRGRGIHLKLLTIFFAASAYIAGSSGVPGSVSRTVQSGSTFLHGLIKLTNKTNSKLQNFSSPELDTHLAVFRAMFNLLSNLALSAECRGVMWKVGWWAYHVSIFTYTAWHDAWLFSVPIKNAHALLSFHGPKRLQVFFLCVLRILIFCFDNTNTCSSTVIASLADTSL